MSEILEGPVERIIVETKEAPVLLDLIVRLADVSRESTLRLKERRRRPLLSHYMKFNLECFLTEGENIFVKKQAWKMSRGSRFYLRGNAGNSKIQIRFFL